MVPSTIILSSLANYGPSRLVLVDNVGLRRGIVCNWYKSQKVPILLNLTDNLDTSNSFIAKVTTFCGLLKKTWDSTLVRMQKSYTL